MNIFRTALWIFGLIVSLFIVLYNFIAHYNSRMKCYALYMSIGIVLAAMFIMAIFFEVAGV